MRATWMQRAHRLASGAILLLTIPVVGDINFNQVWFSFLTMLVNLLIAVLLGGGEAFLTDAALQSPLA